MGNQRTDSCDNVYSYVGQFDATCALTMGTSGVLMHHRRGTHTKIITAFYKYLLSDIKFCFK